FGAGQGIAVQERVEGGEVERDGPLEPAGIADPRALDLRLPLQPEPDFADLDGRAERVADDLLDPPTGDDVDAEGEEESEGNHEGRGNSADPDQETAPPRMSRQSPGGCLRLSDGGSRAHVPLLLRGKHELA